MSTARATILFAEDDSSLAFMVKDALEDEGYKVVHCADGQTAIETFDKDKFDICLLDIMMPYKDGYTVAKKIRQQTDVMPVLFLTQVAAWTPSIVKISTIFRIFSSDEVRIFAGGYGCKKSVARIRAKGHL